MCRTKQQKWLDNFHCVTAKIDEQISKMILSEAETLHLLQQVSLSGDLPLLVLVQLSVLVLQLRDALASSCWPWPSSPSPQASYPRQP